MKRGLVEAALAAMLMTAPILQIQAAAFEPAGSDCKACVMKCVMEYGRPFSQCLPFPFQTSSFSCATHCLNIDRTALRRELRESAKQQCQTDLEACMKKAGGDNGRQGLCKALNYTCWNKAITNFSM